MKARPHLDIAFDVFDLGIQKRRLLEGQDPETSDDWTTGHPVMLPYTLAVGNNFQIRVPIDDTNTLHIRYETARLGPDEEPQTTVPAFDLPYKGFLNITPLYYQEWNHNTFTTPGFVPAGFTGLPDGNTHFNATWAVEINYYMDLGFLPPNLQYFAVSGRAGWVLVGNPTRTSKPAPLALVAGEGR